MGAAHVRDRRKSRGGEAVRPACRLLRTIGFGLVGVSAAIAAILINSSRRGQPEHRVGLLLPAYAAAFLGSSMFRVGVFTPIGTALGALYLQIDRYGADDPEPQRAAGPDDPGRDPRRSRSRVPAHPPGQPVSRPHLQSRTITTHRRRDTYAKEPHQAHVSRPRPRRRRRTSCRRRDCRSPHERERRRLRLRRHGGRHEGRGSLGAKAAGAKVSAPTGKTIGVILLSGTSAQSLGVLATAKQIAKMFGYKVITCDPNFDPQKVVQCATSIVAQHPSGHLLRQHQHGVDGLRLHPCRLPGDSLVQRRQRRRARTRASTTTARRLQAREDPRRLSCSSTMRTKRGRRRRFRGRRADGGHGELQCEQAGANATSRPPERSSSRYHNLDLSNAVQDTISSTKQALQQNPGPGGLWTLLRLLHPADGAAGRQGTDGDQQGRSWPRSTRTRGGRERDQEGTISAVSDLPWQSPPCGSRWTRCCRTGRARRRSRGAPRCTRSTRSSSSSPYLIDQEQRRPLRQPSIPVFGPDYQTYLHDEVEEGVRRLGNRARGRAGGRSRVGPPALDRSIER